MDVFGNDVNITVLTDAIGQFAFTGLNAGFYTVSQTQPEGFSDGIDTGDPSFTIGDDQFSDIVLNWGQVFDESTFGERLPGAAGNPPNLPGLGPIANSPIGRLLGSFATSSSTIYSGIPINSNANPLSLDSGREVSGGYAVALDDACGCPVTVDAGAETNALFGDESYADLETPIAEQADSAIGETEVVTEDCDCECEAETTQDTQTNESLPTHVIHVPDACDPQHGPHFLKRFSNWLCR
jgi:hypothetical protein